MTYIKSFFKTNTALNKTEFCKEADVSVQTLLGILRGSYKLSKELEAKLLPVMEKYGYKLIEQSKK